MITPHELLTDVENFLAKEPAVHQVQGWLRRKRDELDVLLAHDKAQAEADAAEIAKQVEDAATEVVSTISQAELPVTPTPAVGAETPAVAAPPAPAADLVSEPQPTNPDGSLIPVPDASAAADAAAVASTEVPAPPA